MTRFRLSVVLASLCLGGAAAATSFMFQEPGGEPASQGPPLRPFELGPMGENPLRWDDLAPPDQGAGREARASVEAGQTWAETQNGPDTHKGWSRYTDAKVTDAEVQRATFEAGLHGIGDLGVH
jgi:hypothetical protein